MLKPEPAVSIEPHISGPRGKAWMVDIPAALRRVGKNPIFDANLEKWIIEAPWAHPAWHSYVLTLIGLQRMLDAKIVLQDATHEMSLLAIDPDYDRNRFLIDGYGTVMIPANFAAQFIEIDDRAAIARIRAAVQEICNGHLNPDTDFRLDWARLFGDNMLRDRSRLH